MKRRDLLVGLCAAPIAAYASSALAQVDGPVAKDAYSIANAVQGYRLAKRPLLTAVRCITLADMAVWQAFTGQAPDMIHAFGQYGLGGSTPYQNNVGTFDQCIGQVESQCAAYPGIPLIWAIPLATNTQAMTAVSAGTFDQQYTAMFEQIEAHQPNGDIFVRLGHEAGFGYGTPTWPWAVTNATTAGQYIAAFQHVAALMRNISPRLKAVWCVPLQSTDSVGTVFDPTGQTGTEGYYPGNAYVDVISIDAYYVASSAAYNQTFDTMSYAPAVLGYAANPYGIRYIADFARASGKPMSFDEWMVGMDNPGYVRDMGNFINDPANNVLYHGVWNRDASSQFTCRLTPDGSVQKPLSRAAYLHGFHGVGAPLSEQSETSTFINRAPNIPTGVMSVYRNEIDTLYAALKSFGLLQYLDALYMLAGPDNDTTLLSLTTPGGGVSGYTVANYKLSRTGSPIFTANSGWSGDGSTSDYLSTGINLSTAPALKASQNSMHMGAWFLTANPGAGATSSYDVGCAGSAIGINGAGYFQGQPNYGSPKTMSAAAAAPGHIMWNSRIPKPQPSARLRQRAAGRRQQPDGLPFWGRLQRQHKPERRA